MVGLACEQALWSAQEAQNKDLGVAKQAISDHARRFFSRPCSRDFPTACVLERGVILCKLNDL